MINTVTKHIYNNIIHIWNTPLTDIMSLMQSMTNNSNKNHKINFFELLPVELSLYILSYCNAIELCIIAQCNHYIRDISNSNELWYTLCEELWLNNVYKNELYNNTYYDNIVKPTKHIDYDYITDAHNRSNNNQQHRNIVDSLVYRHLVKHHDHKPFNNNIDNNNNTATIQQQHRSYKKCYIESYIDLQRTFITHYELCNTLFRFEFSSDLFVFDLDDDNNIQYYYPVFANDFIFIHYNLNNTMSYRLIDSMYHSDNNNNNSNYHNTSFVQRIFENHIGPLTRRQLQKQILNNTNNSNNNNIYNSNGSNYSNNEPTMSSRGLLHYPIGYSFSSLNHIQQIDHKYNRQIQVNQYPLLNISRNEYDGRWILTNQFVKFTSVHENDSDYQHALHIKTQIEYNRANRPFHMNRHRNDSDDSDSDIDNIMIHDIDDSDVTDNNVDSDTDMSIQSQQSNTNSIMQHSGNEDDDDDVRAFLFDRRNRHG